MKIALLVAYDGTSFSGFARQRSARTVQGLIEEKLSVILRTPVVTACAGRTDAGVHAASQVMSFPVAEGVEPAWVRQRLNKWIAPEVVVRAAVAVPDDFDARFSAVRRRYEYRCYRSEVPDPFRDRFTLWVGDELSVRAMRAGAKLLLGEHDFASFCRRGQTGTQRRLRAVRIAAEGDELVFRIEADAFCHQMVRSIVGLLLDVGKGKRAPSDVAAALAARDRAAAGPVAPARGLHLVDVVYRPNPFSRVASADGRG